MSVCSRTNLPSSSLCDNVRHGGPSWPGLASCRGHTSPTQALSQTTLRLLPTAGIGGQAFGTASPSLISACRPLQAKWQDALYNSYQSAVSSSAHESCSVLRAVTCRATRCCSALRRHCRVVSCFRWRVLGAFTLLRPPKAATVGLAEQLWCRLDSAA